MSTPLSPDQKAAKALGLNAPEEVEKARSAWNTNRITRHVLKMRLEDAADERRGRLEHCAPDELLKLQGEIAGIKLAVTLITQPEK